MRLWSIHPKYLDARRLVAVWREALLAKKVLQGKTKGYKNHPQLLRFKTHDSPLRAINSYLHALFEESQRRDFNFDSHKIGPTTAEKKIEVTAGQLKYEFAHLLKKLKERDRNRYNLLKGRKIIETHPLFKEIPGKIENWEKVSPP